jgi:hypothetical protein
MTVRELYESVAQLGFENSLEDYSAFVNTTNRALLQVNALRPVTKSYFLNHHTFENKIIGAKPGTEKVLSELILEADAAKSFYVEVNGKGHYYVETETEKSVWEVITQDEIESTSTFYTVRGFVKKGDEYCKNRVRIRFVTNYVLFVRNAALYDEIFSDAEEDIPAYGSTVKYDMRALTSDFMAFDEPPINDDGSFARLDKKYDIEGQSILLLPYSDRGEYRISYKKKPSPLDASKSLEALNDTRIDLDEDLAMLLPTLIASYIWVDDEPEKATHYLSIYNSLAALVLSTKRNSTPVQYVNVNGW